MASAFLNKFYPDTPKQDPVMGPDPMPNPGWIYQAPGSVPTNVPNNIPSGLTAPTMPNNGGSPSINNGIYSDPSSPNIPSGYVAPSSPDNSGATPFNNGGIYQDNNSSVTTTNGNSYTNNPNVQTGQTAQTDNRTATQGDGRMTYDEFLTLFNKNSPQQQAIPQFQPTNKNEISDMIKQLLALQKSGYQFDPATNQRLIKAQNQAMQATKEKMGRSGMLYSTTASNQMQQAAQGLTPQYEDMARTNYNNDLNNTIRSLAAISGIDDTEYNRYRNQVSDTRNMDVDAYGRYKDATTFAQDQYKNQQTDITTRQNNLYDYNADLYKTDETARHNLAVEKEAATKNTLDAADAEAKRTGYYMDPVKYKSLVTPIPQAIMQQIAPFSGNYAEVMEKLYKENPQHELLPFLNAARFQKIMTLPAAEREKYLKDYYTETMESKKASVELKGKELSNIKAEIDAIISKTTMTDKIKEAKADLDKKLQDIEKGKVDIEKGKADIADILEQAGLRKFIAQTSRISANASAQGAATSSERLGFDKEQKYSQNVSLAYDDFTKSNLPMSDWLRTQTSNGRTYGEALNSSELKDLIGIAKDSGKLDAKSANDPFTASLLRKVTDQE